MPKNQVDIKGSKQRYDAAFQRAYEKLNTAQKEAVDAIEGPVMVIAGPGTGKTQVLAVRIGKILRDTQAGPHNILCLTFTDSASLSMRKRLVEIIGPEAHQVHIFTFHAFCNQVIRENAQYFGGYRDLQVISELEKVEVLTSILDNLDNDHILKKLKGVSRYDVQRLGYLLDIMKKEHLEAEQFEDRIAKYKDSRLEDKSDNTLFYQVNRKPNKKGDLKQKKWDDLVTKLEETRAAVHLFNTYQESLKKLGRYDYHDMILWVLNAFEQDENILADYQERYQYFLVDEFQDTNGAQKEILDHLISFWIDNPNVFVVGDDDQAIYKFQGANLSNITEMYQRYHPRIVVLEENYRSTQPILDMAQVLIQHNEERLINHADTSFSKNLIAAHPDSKNVHELPVVAEYPNLTHEQAHIAHWLSEAYDRGEDLDEVAIIYRNHKQVDNILSVLDQRHVPYNVKRDVDILALPLVECILTIMEYIQREYEHLGSGEELLFKLLHYHFFQLKSSDNARIARSCSTTKYEKPKLLREAIGDASFLTDIDISDRQKYLDLHMTIDKWIADTVNETLQVLFQNILNDGYILAYIMKSGRRSWYLQVLNTLFDFIKDETNKNPNMDLKMFLEVIDKMKTNAIALRLSRTVSARGGAHFVTAHSAKGMEYNRVIITGVTGNIWDKGRSNNRGFKIPDSINKDADSGVEDERRLFFVAMTRAKAHIEISFSTQNEKGKVTAGSRFVDEVHLENLVKTSKRTEEASVLDNFQFDLLSIPVREIRLIEKDEIDAFMDGFRLSITALNKYLKCPLSFYFEIVLKVPTARTKYMGFGRAIHDALHHFYINMSGVDGGSEKKLIEYFERAMKLYRSHFTQKEFTDMSAYGIKVLEGYYRHNLKDINREKKYHTEVNMDHAQFEGVPLKGFLDKVEGEAQYMTVTDYKTGKYEKPENRQRLRPPKAGNELGGDYWRQIIFYKILADSDKKHPWNIVSGAIDFIEPNKAGEFLKCDFQITGEDVQLVGEQIMSAWQAIQNHEFTQGCNEDSCKWCNFVKSDFVHLDPVEKDEEAESISSY